MNKTHAVFRILLTLVVGSAVGLAAQEKRTVADDFVECPALIYHEGAVDDELSWIQVDLDAPPPSSAQQRRVKRLLLAGVPVDYDHPVNNLVIDAKNGYLHLTVAEDDLTLVYYEKADKTRIVAFRLENTSYQFPTTTWAFFEVVGDRWSRIANQDILPTTGTDSYFPKGKTKTDRNGLLLTEWDIELPHFGTTARLSPVPYSTDLESPERMIALPGNQGTMRYGAYVDWFHQTFENSARGLKSLELKWNKATARFDAGKIAVVPPAVAKPLPGRNAAMMLSQPQNVWEDFLSDPQLVYDDVDGLSWNPQREDHEGWAQKQELLADGTLGLMVLDSPESLVVDLPGGYLDAKLSRAGRSSQQGALQFTLVSYPGPNTSRLVGYRFWGHQREGDADGPRTEYNQIAAAFRRVSANGEVALNDADIFPMDRINQFALAGATAREQALQAVAVWDVHFPRTGSTVNLVPWRLKPLSPAERTKLVTLFGSEEALTRAFADFVRNSYARRALALTWNVAQGRFENPVEVSR